MSASKPESHKAIKEEIPKVQSSSEGKVGYFFNQSTRRYQYMSKGINNLTGYSIDELNEMGFKSIVKEVITSSNDQFKIKSNEEESGIIEEFYAVYKIETKDKQTRWIEDNAITHLNEEGKRIYSTGVLKDITQIKNEEKIQRVITRILHEASSERNLNELFKFIHNSVAELMPVNNFYIALYDKENDMITFPYFVDQNDKEAPPMKFGKGLTEYVLRIGKPALISKKLDDELISKGETVLIGTQSPIWLGVPLKIKDKTIGVIVVQDYENENTYNERHKEILETISYPISMAIERKLVEQDREELINKLSKLNQSKDKLLSLISHDLRSPFNSLLGFSEILTTEYESLTDEEIKEYLNAIYEASKNLFGMTNNLLQLSQFHSGKIEFKPVKVNIGDLVKSSMRLLRGNALKKQINIITKIFPDLYIYADEDMLFSVVQNFISNAIKFTEKNGNIIISASSVKSENSDSDEIEFIIEDNGIGITEQDLKKIMEGEMFSTPGTEREYGTGLGFIIIKEFIEKNNGVLIIESERFKGSRFICRFPSIN